jgi:hypothetical protein
MRDSEVTFRSTDGVLFPVRRAYLDAHTGGFPPSDFATCDEIVPLTEDSTTLELLFQFVYPKRHPDLALVPFEVLYPLTEAAEKYEVYSAMNICSIRMKYVELSCVFEA